MRINSDNNTIFTVNTGSIGAIGLQGAQGAQGLQGAQGAQGAQGFQGGAQGAQGAVGANGTAGTVATDYSCKVTGTMTLSAGVFGAPTTLDMDTQVYDTDTMWDVGDPERITFTTAGKYLITAWIECEEQDEGYVYLELINGGSQIFNFRGPIPLGLPTYVPIHVVVEFGASEYIYTRAAQNSLSDREVSYGISVVRVGG